MCITGVISLSAVGFQSFCANNPTYSDVFVCDGYRLCRAAKLLMSLGYGNFINVIRYDIYAMAESFFAVNKSWDVSKFQSSKYSLVLGSFESTHIYNSPNLSIFPLLAYHKICNDHYIYRQWQPYQASLCNVDYLTPNASSLLNIDDALLAIPSTIKADSMNLLDMRFSNLPLDYFTGVLPTAQFGEESVASFKNTSNSFTTIDNDSWFVDGGTSMPSNAAVPSYDCTLEKSTLTCKIGLRKWR